MSEDAVTGDPFRALGLPASGALTDEDVRAGWRRIAVTTHPDREDGGDLARFSAAAAAYETLRTSYGRGEALADLAAGGGPGHARSGGGRSGGGRRKWPRRRTGGGAHRAGKRTGEARQSADGGHQGVAGQPGGGGRGYPGFPAIRRGLALRVVGTAVAAATVAAVIGWTPATIGLLTGALTVAGWALWRRSGGDR